MASLMIRLWSEKRKHKELPLSRAHIDSGQRRPNRDSRKKTEDRGEEGRPRPLGSL